MSEALVAKARTALGRGCARGTAATRAALAAANAVSMSGVQGRALGLPESAAVSGRVRGRLLQQFVMLCLFRNKPLSSCIDSTIVCFCQPLGSNEETE